MSSNTTDNFEPLIVIEFSPSIPNATKDWFIKRLTDQQQQEEGADLLVRYETTSDNQSTNMILVGGAINRLLAGAEELQIKKKYKNSGLREFLISDMEHFDNSENPDDFLLKSEKQRIVWEEIQNLRPMKHEHSVPGVPTKLISPENDTILSILNSLDFIVNLFPLHDKDQIKRIGHDWFMSKDAFFKSQDIHTIRNYFGDNVAFYFAFLEYYTTALVPPAILGLLVYFWPSSDFAKYAVFCIFNVLWWTIFMERWKRYTNRLAYEWGSFDLKTFERPRSLYYGDLSYSPITNRNERQYPSQKRMLKKYLVGYPFVMICIAISIKFYFTYCRIQKNTDDQYPMDGSMFVIYAKTMRMIPSISYSLLIIPVNLLYKKLATLLTDFENHRLQSAYENNLTSKLFIFYFVNCFCSLFYEAFFNINYANVAQLLTSLVIINAFLLKFTEQIGPYIFKRVKKNQLNIRTTTDKRVSDPMKQAKTLTPFLGTYSDYLTIFEQYGYVALFSAVFPWVTICALVNNIFELRADAFKYCYVYQRPFAKPAWNIGSWHHAFDILSTIAILTNTALIAIQPSVREYFSSYSDVEYVLLFIAAEHILLALKFAIDFAIPDVPQEVKMARIKNLYESNQALRRERQQKALAAQQTITKL